MKLKQPRKKTYGIYDLFLALTPEEGKNLAQHMLHRAPPKELIEIVSTRPESVADVLLYGFTWIDTAQGEVYWGRIWDRLEYGSDKAVAA